MVQLIPKSTRELSANLGTVKVREHICFSSKKIKKRQRTLSGQQKKLKLKLKL